MDTVVLTSLTANLSEVAVYAAIAIVTLIGFCKCIYPLLRNAALLNRAVIKLEKSTAAGDRPQQPHCDSSEPLARLSALRTLGGPGGFCRHEPFPG